MTDPWHLSRVRLREDASVRTLAPLLLPAEENARISASHRLVWSLFADDATRKRDFLWHEEEMGAYLVFSPDKPPRETALFNVESKPFVHWPEAGERLRFALRVNPTRSIAQQEFKASGKRKSGQRVDVIMHALHPLTGRSRTREPLEPGKGRAFLRDDMLGWLPEEQSADPRRPIEDWMAKQGEKAGFRLTAMQVNAYRSVRLPRSRSDEEDGKSPLVFGQADVSGELIVSDAVAFAARLRAGFGRAKAFGCGLMLLARQGG
jgi:CRISPR system Cascade subunit CasE